MIKNGLYDNHNYIVGFKIDPRYLYALRNEEVYICSMEVCLPNADKGKFLGDISKLLREGRVNTTSLLLL